MSDAPAPADSSPPQPAVDFTVSGCPRLATNVEHPQCIGQPPLTVTFIPVYTSDISPSFTWYFGDGTQSPPDSAPTHTYHAAGHYDVTIIGSSTAGGGPASTRRPEFIVVEPNGLGDPCDTSSQCLSGLHCVCPSDEPRCTTGPVAGLCTASCASTPCSGSQVCANLKTASQGVVLGEAWQQQLCLKACEGDSDCGDLHCRLLPPGPQGGDWVRGCFADTPADMGKPCRAPSGDLANDLCVGGLCADLGGLGVCSSDCSSKSCPPGSECVAFGDGRQLCLVPCSSSFKCDMDPLLTCVAPGPGPLGYWPQSSTTGAGVFCAPRPCSSNDACGPAGTCRLDPNGGHCVRWGQ